MQLDDIIRELIGLVEETRVLKRIDNTVINRVIVKHLDGEKTAHRKYSKKNLLPHYAVKGREYWGISPETEKKLISVLQIKPRRTASGVATITVMTKPWSCNSACVYCPNDLRMPKSYLTDEPVCQRAEYVYFDPYMQVISRLRALKQMGHPTDKIELIILGGTWSDYPKDYQIWYVKELFRALNESEFRENDVINNNDDYNAVDNNFNNFLHNQFKIIKNGPISEASIQKKEKFYQSLGLTNNKDLLAKNISEIQNDVYAQKLTYNQAFSKYYRQSPIWQSIEKEQVAKMFELEEQQTLNVNGKHRCVGLVIETRPDTINIESLKLIRELGCTKVQMGVQSLDEDILLQNRRNITVERIVNAHSLLRLFGFKIHIHFMVNLFGSSPDQDKADYLKLVSDPRFLPDEVKLYPCMLIQGTKLVELYNSKKWIPYNEDTLVDVLISDTINTPRYIRISRMIRDFSAHDIVAGNKKTNLRQVVEQKIENEHLDICEVRHREIGVEPLDINELSLKSTCYETDVTTEYFLEWVALEDKIAGFLRLSLPKTDVFDNNDYQNLPFQYQQAMIREVHIYGKTVNLSNSNEGSQHQGLGRKLIAKACEISKQNGFEKINVISAVGTRGYYRGLDFYDYGLYQQKEL